MKTSKLLALAGTALLAVSACTGANSPSPSSAAPASQPAASQAAASVPAGSGATGSGPVASGPAGSAPAASGPVETPGGSPASVRLQLQWTPQAQFAGYFAADKQGFYKAENLTVEFVAGGPTIAPHTVGSAPNGPEFTISWVPKVLQARESGSDLVDIAQVFQRSGTLSVAWKDSGIDDPCDVKGKKVGAWAFGNEYEVTAGLSKNCGFKSGTDYEQITQNFDMVAFLNKEIDFAEAMIYNEYAQVLEAQNQATGQLHTADELNIINWNDYRSAMLQDAIFARKAWLSQGDNRGIAVRFVRASLRGWIYCRDHQDDCIQYTVDAGSQLPAGHQRWMMNEINGLVWPSPLGVGVVDPVFWTQSVQIAKQAGIIKADPTFDAYDPTIAVQALASIVAAGEDPIGANFKKADVKVTAGGK